MKGFLMLIWLLLTFLRLGYTQHTFSIVAIDSLTREVGSAGATCLDSEREGLGAVVISDVFPGKGAIHSQALLNFANQANARLRMEAGDSPQQIIDWVVNNDVQRIPQTRQYGIVAFNDSNQIQTAAFTGRNCLDVKNHILGPNYAIQGNILIGTEVLDSMEDAFLRTQGSLADKLMASLNAAAFEGADVRCLSEGVSSRSAFLRVAKRDDSSNKLFMDLVVNVTPFGIEPIEELFIKFLQFEPNASGGGTRELKVEVYPNPFANRLNIQTPYSGSWKAELFNLSGKRLNSFSWDGDQVELENLEIKETSLVLLKVFDVKRPKTLYSQKLIVSE